MHFNEIFIFILLSLKTWQNVLVFSTVDNSQRQNLVLYSYIQGDRWQMVFNWKWETWRKTEVGKSIVCMSIQTLDLLQVHLKSDSLYISLLFSTSIISYLFISNAFSLLKALSASLALSFNWCVSMPFHIWYTIYLCNQTKRSSPLIQTSIE